MILDNAKPIMFDCRRVIGDGADPLENNAPKRGGAPGSQAGGPATANAPRWSATSCSPTDSLRSTIGARGLNFRVRNGTGCASPAMVADQRGAFCCQGGGFRRALGAAQRGFSTYTDPRDRMRPNKYRKEELGLLVPLG